MSSARRGSDGAQRSMPAPPVPRWPHVAAAPPVVDAARARPARARRRAVPWLSVAAERVLPARPCGATAAAARGAGGAALRGGEERSSKRGPVNEALRQVMRAAEGAGRLIEVADPRAPEGAAERTAAAAAGGVADGEGPADDQRRTGGTILTGSAEHPVCGDVVEVDVQLHGDAVRRLAWRAQGCPATMAVAAAAHGALVGQPLPRAADLLRQRLHALGGLGRAEQHALALFLDALHDAASQR